MKTYLFDTINRYKRFSENLDVKAILCNKSWIVFNNSGEKETYIFQESGTLIISLNGEVINATWQYIPANKSLIISGNDQSYMVHTAYVDNILFVLQVDGTQNCAFLIDENNKQYFQPQTYNDIKLYFQVKEQKLLQQQEAVRLESERLVRQKKKEEKVKRRNEEKKKKTEQLRFKADRIRHINGWIQFLIVIGSWILYVILGTMLCSFKSIHWLMIVLIIIGSPCFIFFIPYYMIKYIGDKKAKDWKRIYPNDAVNQYL